MSSWKPEIQVAGDPKWYDNAVRFKTRPEAERYAADLFSRWTSAKAWRVIESDDPVNSFWNFEDGDMVWADVDFPVRTVDDHEL